MYKAQRKSGWRFTLVELLVAMSVFSLLLVLMMQFFSGAQKIWVSTEEKNNLYADARVAMDLIATFLQGTYFSQGGSGGNSAATDTHKGVPFVIENGTSEKAEIYFPTQTQMDLIENAGEIVFVTFQRGETNSTTPANDRSNELRMAILSDSPDDNASVGDFSLLFPPYNSATTGVGFANRNAAETRIKELLQDKIKEKIDSYDPDKTEYHNQCIILLDNVTAFRIIPMKTEKFKSATSTDDKGEDDLSQIPFLVEIQLSLMDKKSYELWKELKDSNAERAKEFRLQHEHTFSRTVYLGDRWSQTF